MRHVATFSHLNIRRRIFISMELSIPSSSAAMLKSSVWRCDLVWALTASCWQKAVEAEQVAVFSRTQC